MKYESNIFNFHDIEGVITRTNLASSIQTALKRSRIVALAGTRQCGKTMLARELIQPGSPAYFDLEDPVSLARLEQPKTTIEGLKGLVVIAKCSVAPVCFQCCVCWRIGGRCLPSSSSLAAPALSR